MSIFFTSDTHFGHTNIIKYSNRPFSGIEHHDESLIKNWNDTVRQNDEIYHLGDFSLANPKHALNIVRRLKGRIYFLYGNHDKALIKSKEFLKHVEWHGHYKELSVDNQKIVLFHFPIESWNKRHYESYHLHGHCHGSLPSALHQLRVDVGVDVWNYTPVSLDQIKKHMSKKVLKPIDHHDRNRGK